MSGTNYTANPTAIQQPSLPPGPGVLPTVYLPADTDGASWANLAQGTKTDTDFIGHIQSAVRLDTPAVSPGTGFTQPVRTGTGTGTITPGSSSVITGGQLKTAAGLRVQIKIVTPGAIGTATFQTSLDGGNTYGSVQTSAATVTDSTSHVVQSMAGTFVAGDIYNFRSAFTPLASWVDNGGRNRSLVSHNGFAGGQVIQNATAWDISATDGGRWTTNISGGGNVSVIQAPPGLWHGRALNIQMLATSGLYVSSQTALPLVDVGETGLSFELEWIATAPSAPTNITYLMGLGFGSGAPSGWNYLAAFKKASTDTNWQIQYRFNGGTLASTDSGVAGFALNSVTRFKIEVQGSATPIGIAFGSGVVLYFVDGNLVGAQPITAGSQPLIIAMDTETTGTISAGNTLQVGPVRWRYNLIDNDAVL